MQALPVQVIPFQRPETYDPSRMPFLVLRKAEAALRRDWTVRRAHLEHPGSDSPWVYYRGRRAMEMVRIPLLFYQVPDPGRDSLVNRLGQLLQLAYQELPSASKELDRAILTYGPPSPAFEGGWQRLMGVAFRSAQDGR